MHDNNQNSECPLTVILNNVAGPSDVLATIAIGDPDHPIHRTITPTERRLIGVPVFVPGNGAAVPGNEAA